MSPDEVLRLAKRIENTLGPALIVSVKEKVWLTNALRGLVGMMRKGRMEKDISDEHNPPNSPRTGC